MWRPQTLIASGGVRRFRHLRKLRSALLLATAISLISPATAGACVSQLDVYLADVSRAIFVGTVVGERRVDSLTTAWTVRTTEHVTGRYRPTWTVYGTPCGFGFAIGSQGVFLLGDFRRPSVGNSAAFQVEDGRIQSGHLNDAPPVTTLNELLSVLRARLPDTATAARPAAGERTTGNVAPLAAVFVLFGLAAWTMAARRSTVAKRSHPTNRMRGGTRDGWPSR